MTSTAVPGWECQPENPPTSNLFELVAISLPSCCGIPNERTDCPRAISVRCSPDPSVALATAAALPTSAVVMSPTSTVFLPNIAASPCDSCVSVAPVAASPNGQGPGRGWRFRSTRAREQMHRSTDGSVHPYLRMQQKVGPIWGTISGPSLGGCARDHG